MADKWTALNSFWNSFDIPAYDENTVPDDAQMPYITYEASVTQFNDKILLSASIWYRGMSWAGISQKAEQIDQFIGDGGAGVPYTGGRLWVTKGSPFAQRLSEEDKTVRRMLIQIEAEFH